MARKATELLSFIEEKIYKSNDFGSIRLRKAVRSFFNELIEDLDTAYEDPADATEESMKKLDEVIEDEEEEVEVVVILDDDNEDNEESDEVFTDEVKPNEDDEVTE